MKKINKELHAVIEKYKDHPEFLGIDILDPNQPGAVDDTLMHIAARNGDLDSIEVLLNSGAKINSIGDLGNTPLHQAAMLGQVTTVRILVQKGANPRIENEFNQTALRMAELGGHNEIVDLLKEYSEKEK
jgi:ankyrin repeat protein